MTKTTTTVTSETLAAAELIDGAGTVRNAMCVEASSIGWKPGFFPKTFHVPNLGFFTRQPFPRVTSYSDVFSAIYTHGPYIIEVLND
jgi:hypothetical protein